MYAAPTANLAGEEGFADTGMFSLNGRIGRVRWIAYMFGTFFLVSIGVGLVLALVTMGNPEQLKRLDFVNSIASLAVFIIVSRRRLQDLGLGPVFLGLAIIPFINLYFFFMMMFKRGDKGANEYGLEPSPNTRAVYALAWIIPAIMVIGILAAVAIPAYQDYTGKSRANAERLQPQR